MVMCSGFNPGYKSSEPPKTPCSVVLCPYTKIDHRTTLTRAGFNVQWCTKCAVMNESVQWWKAVFVIVVKFKLFLKFIKVQANT